MPSSHSSHSHHDHEHAVATTSKLIDPVCGMTVKSDAPHRLMHEGEEALFCSAGCQAKFAADPAKYVSAAPAACCAHDGMPSMAKVPRRIPC